MKLIYLTLDQLKEEKPSLGSFYILKGSIIFNTIGKGLDHPELWRNIVRLCGLFDKLVYENRIEISNSPYCCDRGRVVWKEGIKVFEIYGTPGCEEYSKILRKIFGLDESIKEDWKTDSHYRIVKSDMVCLNDMISLLGKEDFIKKQIIKLIL